VSQQLANRLRALHEEDTGLLSAGPFRQSLDGLDLGGIDVGDHCSMLHSTNGPGACRALPCLA
jgi:hypothetical protein